MEVKPGYKQTEVGIIPEDWEIIPLSKVVSRLEAGISVKSTDTNSVSNNEYAILKTSCISKGQFDPNQRKRILPSDLKRAKCNPKKDRILISRMNTPDLVAELLC